MAKSGARQIFAFVCTVCKSANYIADRNKVNVPDKIEQKKYCRKCRKHTLHKENPKLK